MISKLYYFGPSDTFGQDPPLFVDVGLEVSNHVKFLCAFIYIFLLLFVVVVVVFPLEDIIFLVCDFPTYIPYLSYFQKPLKIPTYFVVK